MEQTKIPTNLLKKLFDIQKSVKSFANTEESDKKEPNGKNSYNYTPGWKITEAVRTEMDKQGLMLIPDVVNEQHDLIDYPVYKVIDGVPRSFTKKEMYVTLTVNYTWVDTTTGDTYGPIRMVSPGANGTDKSGASALSLAERQFFLKFFHIATKDENEEPDAHDSANLTGLPKNQQPNNATASQACAAAQVNPYGQQPLQQPAAYQPQYFAPQTPVYPQQFPQQAAAPQYQPMPQQAPRPDLMTREKAVERLTYFEQGTDSYNRALNDCLTQLAMQGFPTSDPTYVQAIKDEAKAKRENK